MSTPSSLLDGLDDAFRRALPELGTDWQPDQVPEPDLIALNRGLASEIGLDPDALQSAAGVAALSGNALPDGSVPIAMGYAGHQFGNYSPRLGDGRAVLLGELVDAEGQRLDVHLKGSGRTPYARGGDGKAALGPMLREFLIAEAVHALGIPTARALAVVATGEKIGRSEGPVPGGVLARVATSHLRVGTFEYAARIAVEQGQASGEDAIPEADEASVLARLTRHAIERHFPDVANAENPALALLDSVIDVQASLIAKWMNVGFIHGVMNTDNMTISGETIDYGPCAFMDHFAPGTVFSSIDRQGRYAYGNQPPIGLWNLTRLAEALLPLIDPSDEVAIEAAKASLATYSDRFQFHWSEGIQAKLGIDAAPGAGDTLATDLLSLMESQKADFTNTFRALASHLRGKEEPLAELLPAEEERQAWLARWHEALNADSRDAEQVADAMDLVNPLYIPRNHLVEEALSAAEVQGNLAPFHQLLSLVTHPFTEQPDSDRFAQPAPEDFTNGYQTFCGT